MRTVAASMLVMRIATLSCVLGMMIAVSMLVMR